MCLGSAADAAPTQDIGYRHGKAFHHLAQLLKIDSTCDAQPTDALCTHNHERQQHSHTHNVIGLVVFAGENVLKNIHNEILAAIVAAAIAAFKVMIAGDACIPSLVG